MNDHSALEARIRKLEAELQASRETQERLARRISRRVLRQEALIHATHWQVTELLESRIWKTLTAAGGLAFTTVPTGAITSIGRIKPSVAGTSSRSSPP